MAYVGVEEEDQHDGDAADQDHEEDDEDGASDHQIPAVGRQLLVDAGASGAGGGV